MSHLTKYNILLLIKSYLLIVLSTLIILFVYWTFPRSPNSLYREYNNIKTHQCDLPIYYLIWHGFNEDQINLIHDSFKYWNKQAGREIFIYGNNHPKVMNYEKVNATWIVPTNIKYKYEKGLLAYTLYKDGLDGCIKEANIMIFEDTLKLSKQLVSTTIKHEIGHVLGFGHSPTPWHLMYYDALVEDATLSEWELEALRVYYK